MKNQLFGYKATKIAFFLGHKPKNNAISLVIHFLVAQFLYHIRYSILGPQNVFLPYGYSFFILN
jgi:hypothetical protein